MEDDFSSTAYAPATTQVYLAVRVRLRNLANIRDLVCHTGDGDQPLISTIEEVASHSWLAIQRTEILKIQLDEISSCAAYMAREWLLQMITYQVQLDRQYFIQLFRSILESDASEWSDLQLLYFALTQADFGDETQRLRIAFAVCLQGNFAHKYKRDLEQTRQKNHLHSLSHSTHTNPAILSVRFRIVEKAEQSKVDAFVCPVSLEHEIRTATTEEEKACPICLESYFDFNVSSIRDLIADYPVKTKFCGHIIGKFCLELWWDTPNKDPARHQHRTCPMCRTQICHRETPNLLNELRSRILHSRSVTAVRESTRLTVELCEIGIKNLICEEVALLELVTELERVNREGDTQRELEDKGKLKQMEGVLEEKLVEVKEEKETWRIPDGLWHRAKGVWMDAEIK